MKIVLRENVENLGRRGDVVNVAPGYGRNFLIPKKLAYLDTPGFRKMLTAERRAKEAHEQREKHEAEALAGRISGMSLSIAKRVGEEGHLYGSVTTQEIAELLVVELDQALRGQPLPLQEQREHPPVVVGVRLRAPSDIRSPAPNVVVVHEHEADRV